MNDRLFDVDEDRRSGVRQLIADALNGEPDVVFAYLHGSRDHFLADRDSQDIACYRLLLAIDAALALCYHVATRRFRKAPDDYAACFAVLSDAGLIAADLSQWLQQMARFRNLLVHIYWKLDYGRV